MSNHTNLLSYRSELAEEQLVTADLTAEDGMVVEDTAPVKEVAQVCAHHIVHQNTLIVTHNSHPACSLMPKQPPLTPSLCQPIMVFRGVLDMLRDMTRSHLSHAPPFCRSVHVN